MNAFITQKLTSGRQFWRSRSTRTKWLTAIGAAILLILIIVILRPAAVEEEAPDTTPTVRVSSLSDLGDSIEVPHKVTLESAKAAPLIARSGGRVTSIKYALGQTAPAGAIVVEIDGQYEGNPTQAQISGLQKTLGIINQLQAASIRSAQLAVELAQTNAEVTQENQPLNLETANLGREQADVAVRQAELALQTAQDTGDDLTIRAATIALQNAELAQDQATAARLLTTNTQSLTTEQAQLNVQTAQAALTTTQAQMASQYQQTATQLQVAREQLKLQQVITPVKGEVTRLSVKVGDFVRPSQEIGEVNASAGATARLFVSAGIRSVLRVGQVITLENGSGEEFSGTVVHLASAPSSTTGLWQVNISITNLPPAIYGGSIVTAYLPIGASVSSTTFIPLDALTIRQSGSVIFTVDQDNIVHEHVVEVLGFDGSFVEVRTDLPLDARIILEGNRRLKDEDRVVVSQ